MKHFLQQLWRFDFYAPHRRRLGALLLLPVLLVAVVYPIVEVGFAVGNAASPFNLNTYWSVVQAGHSFSWSYSTLEQWFPHLWLVLVLLCIVFRIGVIVHSYYLSQQQLGADGFESLFWSGTTSFLVAAISSTLLLALWAGLARLLGVGVEWQGNPFSYSIAGIKSGVNAWVPTLWEVRSYWVALVFTVFLKELPGYVVHWLSHRSRLLWLVTHRSHHLWEYLYPTANAPAFSFDFLLSLPSALVGVVVSKLIYTEPLVMEMILWHLAGYTFEIFNHSLAHYSFAFRNPIVRNAGRLFGGQGVYHLVHHSAYPQDQNVNFGGAPFLFWDRLFGTYRTPYASTPPVGLTHQPPIRHNPFRIIYNGLAQLFYEWKMNPDWRTRFCILFGGVYYQPPVTKDFLKQEE
ncbi:MAG: sterol desaturase family protein [Bacteroidetes bacterium]|nr:sterol desaturase family protein [Bacteroidota bacterium]